MPDCNQIYCPTCKRLITLPSVVAGEQTTCPHCVMNFVITPEMLFQTSDNKLDEGDFYGIKVESAGPLPLTSTMPFRESVVKAEKRMKYEEEEALKWLPVRSMPPNLFTTKTFNAPYSAGFRFSFILTFVLFSIMTWSLSRMFLYLSVGGEQSGNLDYFVPWVLGLLFTLLSFFMGLFSAFVLSGLAMEIFDDTFEGYDCLMCWPREWYVNVFRQALFVLIPFFWAALPALILASIVPNAATFRLSLVFLSELILFPVFCLSALYNKSPVMLHSAAVWKSVLYARQAWGLFYAYTISGGAIFIAYQLLVTSSYLFPKLILSAYLAYYFVVYFRLLGRLSWYCSGRFDEFELDDD